MKQGLEVWSKQVSRPWPSGNRQVLPEALRLWIGTLAKSSDFLEQCVKHLGTLHGVKTLLELARPHLHTEENTWDANPTLLGVRNDIIDLNTGRLLPQTREPSSLSVPAVITTPGLFVQPGRHS